MKKYIIEETVETKLIKLEEIVGIGINILQVAPPGAVLQLAGFAAGIIAGRAMKDRSVTKISTVEELRGYRNCASTEWKTKVLYYEHPYRQGYLIEAALYKDYILREMVSDIANYIMDNLSLKRIVVGYVAQKNTKAELKVPVQSVNVDANIKCDLHSDYLFSVEATTPNAKEDNTYVWIKMFPDIIAAVEHAAGKMEVRKKVALGFDVGMSSAKIALGKFSNKKDCELYITYVKE